MRGRPLWLAAVVLVLAVAAIAAGCGGDGGDDSSTLGDIRANGTDVAFVNAMIPHHEQAVDAADLALARAEHPQLKRLAREIIQSQSVELTTLRMGRTPLRRISMWPPRGRPMLVE